MTGFRKKSESSSVGNTLFLATDTRLEFSCTDESDNLAEAMLKIACERAKNWPPESIVIVGTLEVPGVYHEVHFMELKQSFDKLAPEYGFKPGLLYNGAQFLQKL